MGDYKPFSFDSGDAGGESGSVELGERAHFLAGNGGDDSDGNGGSDSGDFRDANGNRFDPAIHSGRDKFNRDGSYRRKRGRKAGGSNSASSGGKRRSSNQAGIDGLTRALAIVHIGLASATKTPELRLEDEEAETLAQATANVLVEFDIKPNPKAEAIFGLVTAASMIYGPRAYLIMERKKEEKAKKNNVS